MSSYVTFIVRGVGWGAELEPEVVAWVRGLRDEEFGRVDHPSDGVQQQRRRERAEITRAERAMRRCITEGHTAEDDSDDCSRSWSALKRERKVSVARRAGYRHAKEAFEIAARVREARARLGLTQAELAARIASTQPAIARLEAGGVTPNLDTLRRIAEALGLELIVDLRRARRSA